MARTAPNAACFRMIPPSFPRGFAPEGSRTPESVTNDLRLVWGDPPFVARRVGAGPSVGPPCGPVGCEGHQLSSSCHVGLGSQVGDVTLDGLGGEVQAGGDLACRAAGGQQLEDV